MSVPQQQLVSRFTPQMVDNVRILVEHSPLPMLATEGLTHTVRYVNPALCSLLRQDAEALVGRSL
jgi:hypothetical protein